MKNRYSLCDDTFDVGNIPIESLDVSWERYHPYTFTIDHRNPLASRTMAEGTNIREQIENIRDAILATFPVSPEQFVIKEDNHGLYAAILVALIDDNVDIIEKAMETKRFFRTHPTGSLLLTDNRQRTWIDLRFEPMDPNDVTDEIHRKFNRLYHLSPSKLARTIKENGLKVSNNNLSFLHFGTRVFFMEGEISDTDVQKIVNTLYTQAFDKKVEELPTMYTLLTFDLSKLNKTIRFFCDINEPKGIYTKVYVHPSIIVDEKEFTAQPTDNL